MDLDLEADLGIDTVKQAEVFAAIRETYGIPVDDTLKLRDYPTLNHVVGFVRERAAGPLSSPSARRRLPRRRHPPSRLRSPRLRSPPRRPPRPPPSPVRRPPRIEITARVLALVAEQTGYPTDMLDPELDLEADLGIDTVKQAEVFAAIREAYGIERDDTLKLRDYPTLNHVVGFVRERAGRASASPRRPRRREQRAGDGGRVARSRASRGACPFPVVRPPLERCVPTGVELGTGSRVVLMPDRGGVGDGARQPPAQARRRGPRDRGRARRRGARGGDSPSGKPRGRSTASTGCRRSTTRARSAELDPAALARGAARPRQAAGGHDARARRQVSRPGPSSSRHAPRRPPRLRRGGRDVRHGRRGRPASPRRSRASATDALVKAVDFAPSRKTAALAEMLLDETLRDPGAVEIGHADDLRWTVGLVERRAEHDPDTSSTRRHRSSSSPAPPAASCRRSPPTSRPPPAARFHLLDLVAEPDPDDPDLARFASDRDGLKRELAERIKERGERPTPKLVERELARIERARAALDAIEAIREAGGTAHWHQVDLTDADAGRRGGRAPLAAGGRIDVLLHAAGLEISHFLPDKPQREFDLVFDVKADGWFNLLHALGDSRGRAGRGLQLDRRAVRQRRTDRLLGRQRPALQEHVVEPAARRGRRRGIAIDWTAWADIGMASRGSIPKMMEMAGIDMLPPGVGVPIVRRELTAAGPAARCWSPGSLGMLEERHPTGGSTRDGDRAPLRQRRGR